MTNIISLIGLLIVFILAYGFDHWVFALQRTADRIFAFAPYLWLSSFVNIILGGVLLLLAWYVIFRAAKSKWIYAVFTIVGLLVTFASALIFTIFSTWLPLGISEFLMPTTRVVFVASFIAAIGIAGLILRQSSNI